MGCAKCTDIPLSLSLQNDAEKRPEVDPLQRKNYERAGADICRIASTHCLFWVKYLVWDNFEFFTVSDRTKGPQLAKILSLSESFEFVEILRTNW